MGMQLKAVCSEGNVVRCEIDGHEYVLDYPNPETPDAAVQGTKPGGALMVALAGCKAMVIRMFLAARNIEAPIEVDVEMDGDTASGKFAADFKVKIHIGAAISEKDQRLIKDFVDSKCAVEQVILGSENTIETSYDFG